MEESGSRSQRAKSTVRDPIRENRKTTYAEDDRSQPYPTDGRRLTDDSAGAYYDSFGSSGQVSNSYQASDTFEPTSPSRQFSSAQPRHLSPRPFDPGTGDSLAQGFDALHISSDENYTHSSINAPTSVDWQPPTVSSRHEETVSAVGDSSQPIYSSLGRHGQEHLPAVQSRQQQSDRYVKGTPQLGSAEKIDKSYVIRKKDWQEFFRIGRVFSTLWTDPFSGDSNKTDPTFVSEVIYNERVFSKIRRFVVVREGDRSVSCLPVTSYDGYGHRKNGIRLGDHGFIYSKNKPRKVDGMCSRSLKLTLAKGAAHLKDPSLVNYGKVYTVETNVKVKNVGDLDFESKEILIRYFRRIFSGIGDDPDRADLTPRASEAVLAGVGAALSSYPGQLPSSSYIPASTAGPAFSSVSTTSGYPPSTIYGPSDSSMAPSGHVAYAPSAFSYPPNAPGMHETGSSKSYHIPTTNLTHSSSHATDSTHYSGGHSSYPAPSMHSQHLYPNAPVAASPHKLIYTSEDTMDPSRPAQSSSGFYQPSSRDNYYQQPGTTPLPPNNPSYDSSGYYSQQAPISPPTSAGSGYYPQQGSGSGRLEDDYPRQSTEVYSGYAPQPPYSQPAPSSQQVYDDDIDLGTLDTARETARRRRESRSDRRRDYRSFS